MGRPDASTRRRWRGRARTLAALALAPYLLWLLAAHLFLLTPLGERLLEPRSGRWRVSWRSGWSLHPGRIHLAGFAYRQGPADGAGWRIGADRLEGRLVWSRLARRELQVLGGRAQGVEVVRRGAARPAGPAPPGASRPATRRRAGWRIHLARMELRDVRRIDGGGLALAGSGSARGSLDVRVGERALATLEAARFAGARLRLGGEPFASGLTLAARGRLGPYPPRGHRGLAALDFLDGELAVDGRSLRRAAGGAATGPLLALGAPLRGRLVVRAGRLEPGSELRLDLPAWVRGAPAGEGARALGEGPQGPAPQPPGPRSPAARSPEPQAAGLQAPRLELLVRPPAPGAAAELRVRLEAASLEAGLGGAPAGGVLGAAVPPPTLATGAVRLLARTPERRLSHLLARRPRLGELVADAAIERPRLRGVRVGPLVADLAADAVRGRVDLAALLRRELRLAAVDGEGIELALDPAARLAGARAERPPWTLALDEGLLRVRSVRVGEVTAAGDGTLAVSLDLDPAGDLEVRRFTIAIAGARLLDRGEETARRIAVEVDATLRRTPLRAGVAQLASAVEARVALRGEMQDLGFLDHVARARRWVRLGGSGRVDLALALAAGRLQPGSRLEVSDGALEATGLGWSAAGRGEVGGAVEGETARLSVRLRGLQARREGEPGPAPLRGQRLDLTLTSRDLDLLAAASSLRAELRLAGGEAPDLGRFAALLPDAAGIRLRGGRGTVDAELVADSAGETARGRLRVAGRDVVLALHELELDGRVGLDLALVAERLREGRFRVDGSRVEVSELLWRETGGEARVRGSGWWGNVRLQPGTLTWGRPVRLATTASFELRDSAPLVSLLARRRRLPAWVERAVAVRDVSGSARVVLRPDGLRVEGLEARGGQLELLGRMLLAGERRRGHLYVGLGPLGVGASLEGERRDLRLIRPRAWYASLPPLE